MLDEHKKILQHVLLLASSWVAPEYVRESRRTASPMTSASTKADLYGDASVHIESAAVPVSPTEEELAAAKAWQRRSLLHLPQTATDAECEAAEGAEEAAAAEPLDPEKIAYGKRRNASIMLSRWHDAVESGNADEVKEIIARMERMKVDPLVIKEVLEKELLDAGGDEDALKVVMKKMNEFMVNHDD